MTCAVSAAMREGARGDHLRLDRQHRRVGRRLRRAGRAALRGDRAGGQDRHRQARAGADARRAGDRAARQLRPSARARPRARRPPPDRARELGQRVPDRGPEDGGVRDRRGARRTSSTRSASRSATPATSPPTGAAFRSSAARPRMFGFQAAGAAPLVHGAPVEHPETVASAIRIGNPARWEEAMDAMTASGRRGRGRHRRADPRRLPAAGGARGDLLRAGVGGERRRAARARRRRRRTGSCACSPATASRTRRRRSSRPRGVVPCEPELAAIERAVLGVTLGRRRLVRVPASSANLGPGFDVLAAALALHLELEVVETGSFAVDTDLDVPRDRSNLVVRGFERLHPADELRVPDRAPRSRSSGGLGSSAAAIVAGLMAADHLFELDADVLALATELEGHPDNVARGARGRASSICARGRGSTGSSRRWGSRRCSSSRTSRCGPQQARAALPAQRPARRRGLQRRPGRDADPRAGRRPTGT